MKELALIVASVMSREELLDQLEQFIQDYRKLG